MTTAFKSGAFQLDAFQIDAVIPGGCAGQDYVDPTYAQNGYVCGFYSDGQAERTGGAAGSKTRRRRLVIVEVDGKDYRVPVELLQEFLSAVSDKAEQKPIPKKRKQKQKVVEAVAPPQIVIKSVAQADIELVQRHVDRTNEIMRQVWEGALKRYLEDIEEEEWLLMLL